MPLPSSSLFSNAIFSKTLFLKFHVAFPPSAPKPLFARVFAKILSLSTYSPLFEVFIVYSLSFLLECDLQEAGLLLILLIFVSQVPGAGVEPEAKAKLPQLQAFTMKDRL